MYSFVCFLLCSVVLSFCVLLNCSLHVCSSQFESSLAECFAYQLSHMFGSVGVSFIGARLMLGPASLFRLVHASYRNCSMDSSLDCVYA